MLYPLDEAPGSSFFSSTVRFLLPIPAMASDNPEVPIPSAMEDVPPDPPPPIIPPDPPHPTTTPDMLCRSPIMHAPAAPIGPPDRASAWSNRSDLDRTNISTTMPRCYQLPHAQPALPADDNLPRHHHQATGQSMGPGVLTHLAWNCRGSGGNLGSSTMNHLGRLLMSTRAQVCFLSETRNSSINKTAIKNRFNYYVAFVVPAQGQSGGLWLLWNDDVDLNVVDHSHHFIFALCNNKITSSQYGLVCLYGDPHHRTTSSIWAQVLDFVGLNTNLPIICMGDLNELMHAKEKLGPNSADLNRINEFCALVKQCGFIDLGYNGPAYTWTNKHFSSVPTYERLDRCLGNAGWCLMFPATTVYHLPMMYSDHAPILAVLNSQRPRITKPF